jgi:hypothetical protein
MAFILTTQDARRLMNSVEALGGSAPPAITAIIETAQNLAGAMMPQDGRDQLLEAVSQAGSEEVALGQEEARKLAREIARGTLVGSQLSQHRGDLDHRAALTIQEMLRGEQGEQVVDSLQGAASEAIGGIQRATEWYGPEAEAQEVMAKGGAAVDAWLGAGRAAEVLEAILWTVVRPLTLEWDVFPPEHRRDFFQKQLFAAFFLDPDRAFMLEEVANSFARPLTAFSVPGGRWLEVWQLANGLRLNSPKEAVAIVGMLQDERDQENLARYTPKPVDIGFSEDVN